MKKVLIRRVDNLGDILLMLPALKILREHFKNAKLTLMVKQEHRVLVEDYADNFLNPLPLEDLYTLSTLYNHCINIEYSLPAIIKPNKFLLPKLVHIGAKNWNKPQHVSRHLTDGLKMWGIKGYYQKPEFPIKTSCKEKVEMWLKQNKIDPNSGLLISVDPNSGFEKKSWLLSGFIEVCKYLISELGATIIIPAFIENEKVLRIKKSLPAKRCFILSGQSLDFIAAILKKCDLHLGNDSGIAHLASAVKTPTVTIFGPTDPMLWKPMRKNSIVIVKPESKCPGGYDHAMECKVQKCLINIKIHDVIDGILYSLTKYVKTDKLFSITNLKISDNLTIRKTAKGHILKNNMTDHACVVKKGWVNVKNLLKEVKKTGHINLLLEKQPHQKHLIEMLFIHRVLEPLKKSE